jgi:uncharacterized Zn-finger protein
MNKNTANDKKQYEITAKDLPLHCPMPNMTLWDSHPKVFLPIEDATDHHIICPYCSAEYKLKQ